MTTMYARFIIGRNDWKSSNQRLNAIMAGLRSKRIQDYAEQVWRKAALDQFGIEPIEPQRNPLPVVNNESSSDEHQSMMEKRLEELRQSRDAWDDNHGKELKSSKTSETTRRELQHERNLIVESINRQKKSLTSEKQKIRKSNKKQQRILERTEDKRVVERRLELNSAQRIFTGPVRFNVRVHNISNHYFDSCNSWPTVKPLQDGATRTGIIWDDDNNACIPITTFRGGAMLGHDYVIDILIESMDEPLKIDPFEDYAAEFGSLPTSL